MFFSTRLRPTSELLPLEAVVDDAVLTSRGAFSLGYEILGMESEVIDASVITRAVEILYEAAKNDFPEHSVLQFVVECSSDYDDMWQRYAAAPGGAHRVLDHQRFRRIEYLQNSQLRRYRIYLFVGCDKGLTSREFARYSEVTHVARLAETREAAERVAAALERCAHILAIPLKTAAIWALLERFLNPEAVPASPPVLDEGLPRHATFSTLTPREQLMRTPVSWAPGFMQLGGLYCKVLSLRQLPAQTQFTRMERLFNGRQDFRFSLNIKIPQQARYRGNLTLRKNFARTHVAAKFSHGTSEEGASAYRDIETFEKNLVETHQQVALVGAQVVLSARSLEDLDRRVATFCDHLKPQPGLVFEEEHAAHDREFFKTLPGMAPHFDRWILATSNNAVDLMPIFSSPRGDRRPVLLIRNHREELFSFDPMESKRKNWNAIVLGSSGAGKSVLMNMLLTTAMLANVSQGRLVIVDYAGEEKSSYLNVAKLFGGAFVPVLSKQRDLAINPFPPPRLALGVDGEVTERTLNYLTVVTDMLVANTAGGKDELLYRHIIQRGIRDVYRRASEAAPRFDDLRAVLRSYQGHPDIDPPRLSMLLMLLDGFLQSPGARLLNRPTTLCADSPFTIFDLHGIQGLESHFREALVFIICDFIRTLAFADFDNKYVILDEVAQLMHNPGMVELINDLYSTARKHHTSIWTISQKYAEFVQSKVADTTATNSTTQVFLTHDGAQEMEQLVAKNFSLSAREAAILRACSTYKGVGGYAEALLKTVVFDSVGQGRERAIATKVKIDLSPFDYVMATSDPEDRKRQLEVLAANPHRPVWRVLDEIAYPQAYARQRGMSA